MKKAIFGLFAIFFIMSCENETNTEPTSHKLKFKFYENPDVASRNSEEEPFELGGTVVVNGEQMTLISDDLEISITINQETALESYIIHRKYTDEENAQLRTGGPSRPRIEFGYFYDGNDCWIAGTWIHGDNGVSHFIPGSAATQYLNNICGWSNVA
jgi:hypothetical protein